VISISGRAAPIGAIVSIASQDGKSSRDISEKGVLLIIPSSLLA